MSGAFNEDVVHLEVNDSGAWRRVTSFARDDFEKGADQKIHPANDLIDKQH